jgi:hypothetical protein
MPCANGISPFGAVRFIRIRALSAKDPRPTERAEGEEIRMQKEETVFLALTPLVAS